MRRIVVMTLALVTVLIAGSLFVGKPNNGKRKPTPDQIAMKILTGQEAEAFVTSFSAVHPSFTKVQARSSEFWRKKGKAPLPRRVIQLEYDTRPKPAAQSRLGRFIDRMFPRLRAQSYSDGSGTIILSPWDSDPSVWDGNWYVYFSAANGELSFDAEVTADDYGDVNWTSNDSWGGEWHGGGCSLNPSECDRPNGGGGQAIKFQAPRELAKEPSRAFNAGSTASCGKPATMSIGRKLSEMIWPTVYATCSCAAFSSGRIGDCQLRAALGRARAACGGAFFGCALRGPGYFQCLGATCGGAVFGYFFDEVWDFYDNVLPYCN